MQMGDSTDKKQPHKLPLSQSQPGILSQYINPIAIPSQDSMAKAQEESHARENEDSVEMRDH